MNTQSSARRAETALVGITALALADALFHLAPSSPPDWTALRDIMTAFPWSGPLGLLRAALALADGTLALATEDSLVRTDGKTLTLAGTVF